MTDSPGDVLNLIRDNEVQIVDLRFADLPGLMQHFSVPAHELTEESFDEGFGFDGSSIRGFQEIQESDMILVPDPGTAVLDPFRTHPTLILNCFVKDPITGESYSRDPRHVAAKAERYLVFLRNWAGWTLAGATRPGPDGVAQVRSAAEPRPPTIYEVVVTRAVDDATSIPHGQPVLQWFDASLGPPKVRKFDFARGA